MIRLPGTRLLPALVALLLLMPAAARAEMRYFEDPPYHQINKDDPNPMQDMIDLANQGDSRAQFILGDLYSKGQGGMPRNRVLSRYWFETAARNSYTMAFIRLAAMAKHAHDFDTAYKWYSLSAQFGTASEKKWAKSQLPQVVVAGKMTPKDIKANDAAVKDWLVKSVDLLKAQRVREARYRDMIKHSPTANPDNIIDPANVPAPVTETKATVKKQEFHYND